MGRSTRNRNPRRCSSRRRANSGWLSRRRLSRIRALTAGEVGSGYGRAATPQPNQLPGGWTHATYIVAPKLRMAVKLVIDSIRLRPPERRTTAHLTRRLTAHAGPGPARRAPFPLPDDRHGGPSTPQE